jgi:hypothetical protein
MAREIMRGCARADLDGHQQKVHSEIGSTVRVCAPLATEKHGMRLDVLTNRKVFRRQQESQLPVIEIRPHGNGWKVFETPGVEHKTERLVGAARCCFLLAEQRPKRERQLLSVG